MFEKINPAHPDKLCDRVAGALVDLAYSRAESPKIAVEVLMGHGVCHIISETSEHFDTREVEAIVRRIAGESMAVDYAEVPQDKSLAANQKGGLRCGDNGIFRGVPLTAEQKELSELARRIYSRFPTDGKYVLDKKSGRLIICQSNAPRERLLCMFPKAEVNPLGDWTGGTDADTGAVNRKLGSDLGDGFTGGGIHGKDLSKADVSVNVYVHIEAQRLGRPVELCCAIGDESVGGVPFKTIVSTAKEYINSLGGFEKLAEWGLV